MPRYRIKFLLETRLASPNDVQFTRQGHAITLLFSERVDDRRIHLRAVIDDANWSSAITKAETIISPVMDAIALHQKVDMMLHPAVEVVKAEQGVNRRGVLVDIKKDSIPAHLHHQATQDIQACLDADPKMKRSALRWLRYYYRPLTILERFVFAWMAFENSAGSVKHVNTCTECGKPGCPHAILDTNAAFALVHGAHPEIDQAMFDAMLKSWRQKLRNPVFHGGKVVTAEIRHQMLEAMSKIIPAVEASMRSQAGFQHPYAGALPHGDRTRLIHHFIQFRAEHQNEFADPPRASDVTAVIDNQGDAVGFDLLKPEEFDNW